MTTCLSWSWNPTSQKIYLISKNPNGEGVTGIPLDNAEELYRQLGIAIKTAHKNMEGKKQ